VLPDGFEVALGKIENLGEPGQPLVVNYEVKGTVGVATGKRLLLPASFFESAIKPRFTEAARTLPIDLHYASAVQDAVRLRFPAGFALEAFPAPATEKMIDVAVYDMKSRQDAQSITLSRDLVLVKAYLGASQYPALRQFFSAVEAKDQDKVVLLRSAAEGGAR
jgi:hypothetical protein